MYTEFYHSETRMLQAGRIEILDEEHSKMRDINLYQSWADFVTTTKLRWKVRYCCVSLHLVTLLEFSKVACYFKRTYLEAGRITYTAIRMGYWPSETRKKRTRPISSHLDRTNLVNKGFIIWLLGKFCLRDTAGSPERAANHSARFGSSCPLTELAI